MSQYVCSICGYVYDEAMETMKWEDVSEDWLCPLCSATKSEFYKQDEFNDNETSKVVSIIEVSDDMKELSPLEMSALCTNLARGCEKQYKPEESALFTELAQYFKSASGSAEDPSFDKLLNLIKNDLNEDLPNANAIASDKKDRGALRALTWTEKVTRMLNSILARYEKEGEAMLNNTGIYVCSICGFIYIGDGLPDLCPVCKVPNWKFDEVEGW